MVLVLKENNEKSFVIEKKNRYITGVLYIVVNLIHSYVIK
jgi:hypothetical protein